MSVVAESIVRDNSATPSILTRRFDVPGARIALLALALALSHLGSALAGTDSGTHRVAFFGFHLINSSLEPTSEAEQRRIRMLDELLREKLEASGRFKVVTPPPEMQAELAAAPDIANCNGCERDLAKRLAADLAAWGTVQKVSNLILNINLYMEDVRSGKLEFTRSVDIRGNTDESWRHGLDYMLRHYLFGQP
jgi:hypothetical protein